MPETPPVEPTLTADLAGRFPRGVTDPFCSQDHVVETSTDRRLLWHLELVLAGWSQPRLRETQQALRAYLNATCEHHWHDYEGDDVIAAHRQCLWCCDVEWAGQ